MLPQLQLLDLSSQISNVRLSLFSLLKLPFGEAAPFNTESMQVPIAIKITEFTSCLFIDYLIGSCLDSWTLLYELLHDIPIETDALQSTIYVILNSLRFYSELAYFAEADERRDSLSLAHFVWFLNESLPLLFQLLFSKPIAVFLRYVSNT